MRNTQLLDLSVGEIMSAWPATVRVFLAHQMHCVGCPISPFHTLPEAAEEHGASLTALIEAVEAEIRGSPASAHRR